MAIIDRFRENFGQIIREGDSPHHIAFSFSVGIFLGMSIFFGIHAILALAVAWVFRLNKVAVLSAVFITNPWSIIPIYTFCLWIGTLILGIEHVLPDVDWQNITFSTALTDFGYIILPFIVGTTVVGFFSSILSYFIIKKTVQSIRLADDAIEVDE